MRGDSSSRIPILALYLPPFLGGILLSISGHPHWCTISILFAPAWIAIEGGKFKRVLWTFALSFFCLLLGVLQLKGSSWIIENTNKGLYSLVDPPQTVSLNGIVEGLPIPASDGMRLVVDCPGSGKLLLFVRDATQDTFSPGDAIRFTTRLKRIENPKVEGVWDRESYWKDRGVLFQGSTDYPEKCMIMGPFAKRPIERIREAIVKTFIRHLGTEAGGLGAALLIGEKAWIPFSTKKAFFTTGTGHILAVSGLHLGLVAFMAALFIRTVLLLSRRLPLIISVRNTSVIGASLAALVYALLSGPSPSALRALIMVLAICAAILFKRFQDPFNALSIAAWVIAAMWPFSLAGPGPWLSFVAVFFLILFAPWFAQGPWWKGLIQLTLIAWSATLPLSLLFFHRISPSALVLNLAVVPVTGLFILPGLFFMTVLEFTFAHLAPILTNSMWNVLSMVMNLMIGAVKFVSAMGSGPILPFHPRPYELFLFYALLFFIGAARTKRHPPPSFSWKRASLFTSILLGIFIGLHLVQMGRIKGVQVEVLDVGQGLAQVVFTNEKTVVIDTGPGMYPYDAGARILIPFLLRRERGTIDLMVISHYHQDHAGGAMSILDNLKVKEVVALGPPKRYRHLMEKIREKCREKGVLFRALKRQETIVIGPGARLALIPDRGCMGIHNQNDAGIVARVSYKGNAVLMPADIGRQREECLVEQGVVLRAQVLIAPHHGSLTSSTPDFLEAVGARAVIVSYAPRNPFGYPNMNILARYKKMGMTVLKTPYDGTISIHLGETIMTTKFAALADEKKGAQMHFYAPFPLLIRTCR